MRGGPAAEVPPPAEVESLPGRIAGGMEGGPVALHRGPPTLSGLWTTGLTTAGTTDLAEPLPGGILRQVRAWAGNGVVAVGFGEGGGGKMVPGCSDAPWFCLENRARKDSILLEHQSERKIKQCWRQEGKSLRKLWVAVCSGLGQRFLRHPIATS